MLVFTDFSRIVKPLQDVMPPQNQRKKRVKTEVKNWKWTSEHDIAFNKLKYHMTHAPILAYADYDKEFELQIDASTEGLGAVLCQEQGGQLRVISYASRSLGKSEENYPAMKLEFLCLKWAVTEKFYDYLYGHRFTVKTDNNPLTYILTTAKLDATGQRWVSALSAFDFNIIYKPGKNNVAADALSRYPLPNKNISSDAVQAVYRKTQDGAQIVNMAETIEPLDIVQVTISQDNHWYKLS